MNDLTETEQKYLRVFVRELMSLYSNPSNAAVAVLEADSRKADIWHLQGKLQEAFTRLKNLEMSPPVPDAHLHMRFEKLAEEVRGEITAVSNRVNELIPGYGAF